MSIGSLTLTLHRSGHRYTLVLKLTRSARNALKGQHQVVVTLTLRITSGKQHDSFTRTLKFKHP